ncbi:MAG: hypothetical protein QM765_37360 [Myxococcales bacterium]
MPSMVPGLSNRKWKLQCGSTPPRLRWFTKKTWMWPSCDFTTCG